MTTDRYPPINPKFPHLLHGGDYNPDQWIETPEIWDEDMRLMKLAKMNSASVGIFAWSMLEPEEGVFTFDWLDTIMDKFVENEIQAVLATPSGARPMWLSHKYPEVLRVREDGIRNRPANRHNHCYTSPIYREKVATINRKLAERYKDHPALFMWHLSNEYGGECRCDLCIQAFREWLQDRYGSIDALNHAWWSRFWSHTFTDWDQIEPPHGRGIGSLGGLAIDWLRFVTSQTVDFMKGEIAVLREITPDVPVTTNLMGTYRILDPWKFAPHLDVISWDNYPRWHSPGQADWEVASDIGFVHDLNRSLRGGQPFMLMESVPSSVNYAVAAKRKRPGMHLLSSLQAVAHGSDTVQYFQWRKGRGGVEQYHGAVVDHVGHEHTRVFRDVTEVGQALQQLDTLVGTTVRPDVALIYDWENEWAIHDSVNLGHDHKHYTRTCQNHYRPFWSAGIPVDIIDSDQPYDTYKLLIAPMLYLIKNGVNERLRAFVEAGGVLVSTYYSAVVDESTLCILGGEPGNLRDVFGIWVEETDCLYPEDENHIQPVSGNHLALGREYGVSRICALPHTEGADVLATYAEDFYAGRPAVTRHAFGKGEAWYLASRNESPFLADFYGGLIRRLHLEPVIPFDLPEGVTAQRRGEHTFVMNFNPGSKPIDLGDTALSELLSARDLTGKCDLPGYGIWVLAT